LTGSVLNGARCCRQVGDCDHRIALLKKILVCVFLGTLVSGIGASRSSYRALVAGNVILGLGSSKTLPSLDSLPTRLTKFPDTIESCQSKLYTHWFYGNHLGFVYGVDIAFGRVINSKFKFADGFQLKYRSLSQPSRKQHPFRLRKEPGGGDGVFGRVPFQLQSQFLIT
jgi:hypothetical protein